jgi:hypothetical protein
MPGSGSAAFTAVVKLVAARTTASIPIHTFMVFSFSGLLLQLPIRRSLAVIGLSDVLFFKTEGFTKGKN